VASGDAQVSPYSVVGQFSGMYEHSATTCWCHCRFGADSGKGRVPHTCIRGLGVCAEGISYTKVSACQCYVTLVLQAFNDSARSSGGARPSGGPFGAEGRNSSGPLDSIGKPLKAPSSAAAAAGLSSPAAESCRDVGSIEGWQALAAQIMGEVGRNKTQASKVTYVEAASKAEAWAASPSLNTSP
jgi:hypothetical protein